MLPILHDQHLEVKDSHILIVENIPHSATTTPMLYRREALANWRGPMSQAMTKRNMCSEQSRDKTRKTRIRNDCFKKKQRFHCDYGR